MAEREAQSLGRRLVAPVQVLQDEHHEFDLGEGGQARHEALADGERVGIGCRETPRPLPVELSQTDEELTEQSPRERRLGLFSACPEHGRRTRRPLVDGRFQPVLEEGRLAHSGLALEDDDAVVPGQGCRHLSLEQVELEPPPDDDLAV